MEVSGKPREGLMTIIPITVLIFIVVIALGGPSAFVNTVGTWTGDVVDYLLRLIKYA